MMNEPTLILIMAIMIPRITKIIGTKTYTLKIITRIATKTRIAVMANINSN